MGKVVVFGTGVVAYGVIEESAKSGHHVIHVSTKPDDIASRSNLISEKHLVQFDEANDAELVEFFVAKSSDWKGALLIPVNDEYVVFTSQHVGELSAHYRCTVQPWEIHQEIINKNRLYRHCYDHDVPAPRIYEFSTTAEIERISDEISYPCLLKPHQTPDFFRVFGKKMFEVQDKAQLLDIGANILAHDLDVMISELIPGPVENLVTYISCLDSDGKVLAETFTEKVRENTAYGVASVIKTVPPIREIREYSLSLLRHFSYAGFTATEFKRDEQNGQYKMVEINSRPVLYHRLLPKAGINVVDLMYANQVEGNSPEKQTGIVGVHWMHNLSEIYALRKCLRSAESTLKQFFRPYRAPHIYGLPFWRDPGPLLSLCKRELSAFLGRKFGRG